MRGHEEEIRGAGASIAAVGLGDPYYARVFKEETEMEFPLLIDEGKQAYGVLGLKTATLGHLLRRDNMAWRKRAKAGGHLQHRLGKNPFQLGGSFVFGPGDVDLFAYVSETFGDNASPGDLVAALR